MPVFLNPKYPGPERRSGLNWPRARPGALEPPHDRVLHIGLVNNMADAAMSATEYQFLTLLDAAAGDVSVHVTLYALPGVERKPPGQRRVGSFYFGIEQLWALPPGHCPDGLIVTGREPRTPDLRQEAYWPSFTRLLDWAQEHACSAVWSCLAAHAAVLALDGIERVRSPHKQFGIFACERAAPHALLAAAPARLHVPHSRWNGVPAGQLIANGYRVLTRTSDGGVDTFVKEDAGLFVFFQGHPEYEPETLMGEYRRDVGRYLKGEADTYPQLPLNYFEAEVEQALRDIEARARASRQDRFLGELSAVLGGARVLNTWRGTAALVYRNWLEHLCAQKCHGGTSAILS
ncbi:homoserine O-succinyltransferase MetA [Frigoriglobus tundricola]|uniref:Homoserine O-succinyltransferase n=1 Tax=Frigoriglobus tundricola TaxID=2774151 RepID=A0A6M5YNT2_9BACT|nr:homoserine O-succinyltransferase [Frigoriglobus tundricola]QJW95164.1 Homoserine O-succinyltransferase [Frigoriglobus tundricola]